MWDAFRTLLPANPIAYCAYVAGPWERGSEGTVNETLHVQEHVEDELSVHGELSQYVEGTRYFVGEVPLNMPSTARSTRKENRN